MLTIGALEPCNSALNGKNVVSPSFPIRQNSILNSCSDYHEIVGFFMKIRSKLSITFLTVSLASIATVSSIVFLLVYFSFVEALGQKLEAVASGQKSNVLHVFNAWQDQVNLLRSRTSLREVFIEYCNSSDKRLLARLKLILGDTLEADRDIRYLEIVGLDRERVISVGILPEPGFNPPEVSHGMDREPQLRQLWLDKEHKLFGLMTAPIVLDHKPVGTINTVFDARELIEITGNYDGLGESGETLVAVREEDGSARFLTPIRHDKNRDLERKVKADRADVPIIQALMKNDRIMISPETVDYRDVPVLAATRYIPELDWGLVAKIDRREALAPVNNLIYTILIVTLAISIVVILVGFYLSGSIAAPVVNLASAVRKIKEGELSVRASVTSDDEIGELAESFNAMVSSLNEQQRQLLLLKRAIDASSDLVWIADRVDGTQLITYASETADRVCGYSAEELTGKNPIEVFGGVKDVDEKNSKRFEDAIIRGEAFSGELLNRTKDGRVYWTRLELVPVTGVDGETSCVAGIARDVTIERDYQAALEQSEEQFRQAMQYSPIGMALLSPGGRWLEVNKAVCEIFGYTEAELLTTDFQTMTHPEDLEGDLENVQRLLEGEIKSYFMEKRYVNKGGEIIWCQLSVSLVLNEDDSPKYFISQIQDITESKRARQELLETNAELEEFAYRTSHDLRSPLISSISLLGVTRNSIEEGNSDLALQSIDHAQNSLIKLERLVQDILTLTATKSVEEEVEEIEVKDMVDGIRNSLSHLEGYDRVEFIESFEASERITVGKGRFQLIVENLISNAIKYQDPSKEASFIKISTARNNGEFCFSVEDNGLGVPEEKQSMLFTMFKRFHPRTSFGSGLGLYMIKKSAEKLGGRIEYEGKNGGSEFRLILPWESKN